MTEELLKYERTIKKKHSFGWTPMYEEETKTLLNEATFGAIVTQAFTQLGWDLVHHDTFTLEAKRQDQWEQWTEKITVNYSVGRVKVKSVSLQSSMWDWGKNSKRVKLFIHAFQEIAQQYDKEALATLEEEVKKARNWDDYEIPDSLPQPKEQATPKFWIPLIGGLVLAVVLGFFVAFFTIKTSYIIGIYEAVVGFIIGLVFVHLMRLSNYTDFEKLHYLLIGVIVFTYILNQYFLYELIIENNNVEPFGFVEFIKLRFKEGLTFKSLNLGWIGLVLSWIFQLWLTYAIAVIQFGSGHAEYQLEKVPMEVVDFAYYFFIKGKSEHEIRRELSKMGWTKKEDQDDVFKSIGTIQELKEFDRA